MKFWNELIPDFIFNLKYEDETTEFKVTNFANDLLVSFYKILVPHHYKNYEYRDTHEKLYIY